MVGLLNIPIVPDSFGRRSAGSMTDRGGYDYNSVTKNRVNGRDLYSLRATLGFENDWLRGNFIWERFRESDNRSRTGKQLCHRDASPEMVGSESLTARQDRSEEHTSELQSLMRISYAVFCLKNKKYKQNTQHTICK